MYISNSNNSIINGNDIDKNNCRNFSAVGLTVIHIGEIGVICMENTK